MTELEYVADGIWLAEGEIVSFYGFPYPTRSVIIRLTSDDLWIWSPVRLKPELKARIDALGAPKHLVSPNKIHHLFLSEWRHAYPQAKLWGPQSTIDKRPDLDFQPPLEDDPPADWAGIIDQVRFAGSPVMDEIVFFHRPSRTVILADLSENFSDGFLHAHWSRWKRWIARQWGIVEGYGYAPLEWRLSFLQRSKARRARDQMLAWHPEKVIMAHGEWQGENGRSYLERAFAWLGPSKRS